MSFVSDTLAWGMEAPAPSTAVGNSTELLIARCLAGDSPAYALLYKQHAGFIYRVVYGVLRQQEDAEEVLQDTFEYAFRQLAQFDAEKSAFRTWLYRIAISRCRNKRRRKWLPTFSLSQFWSADPQAEQELDVADPHAIQPEAAAEATADQQTVWAALGQLSDKLRETAVLRYYEELSYEEIGQILGIPAKTVESRMRLAHKTLKEVLSAEF